MNWATDRPRARFDFICYIFRSYSCGVTFDLLTNDIFWMDPLFLSDRFSEFFIDREFQKRYQFARLRFVEPSWYALGTQKSVPVEDSFRLHCKKRARTGWLLLWVAPPGVGKVGRRAFFSNFSGASRREMH